ncbi:MAG: hypothetical protein K2J37_01075 [Ruminococcus sp.]|nr:hypothetical protein [Ruminococcus sp.]MDE6784810.1 hypothetical protein [Ruminococcus sp.]
MARFKLFGKKSEKDEKSTQNNESATAESRKKPNILRWIIAAAVIIVAAALIISIITASGAYKNPVKDTVKGINKGNYERILNSMYTEKYISGIQQNAETSGLSWKDYIKKNDKAVESAMDGLGIRKVKAEIVAKEKMSGSNFERIETYYENKYSGDVRKAYRVEVDFTIKEKGQKVSQKGWLCVVKVKNEGWKLCIEKSDSSFDFIDAVAKISD